MTVGIRLENVTVPSVAIIGQSVGLECQYRFVNVVFKLALNL